MKPVKDIIKDKRLEYNMTMKELAEKVGVSEGTISRWESGEISNMRRGAILSLSKVLNIPPNILMGWDKADNVKLTPKDEREIESDLEDMMNSMASAAYSGQDNIEDIEAFKATIKAAMIQAKKLAKKKYTPKKYRKD